MSDTQPTPSTEDGDLSWWPLAELTAAERRTYLTAAARIRHQHPYQATFLVSLDAPAVPVDDRWGWLDRLSHLADHLDALAAVGSSDDARRVAEEYGEGPWTSDLLAESVTRLVEVDDEINDMIREGRE